MSLELTLELIRADNAGDPFGFQFTPQDYLLRQPDGTPSNARFEWNAQVLADLAELAKRAPDRDVVQRLGDTLRSFLGRLEWKVYERPLEEAVADGRPVHLTFRFAAAELASLPWECLTLKSSGIPLGRLPGCVIQYEWVGTRTAPPRPSPPPEGGRLLFASSTAGGDVRAGEHRDALVRACALGHYSFDPHRDVLEKVSLGRLLTELKASPEPIGALHILCHGTRSSPSSYGLQWDEVVDAGTLAAVLAPHASRIRLVVLCACQSAHPGQLDNHLGSVAVALHRVGISAVIASRLPLSVEGSLQLTETLYTELLHRPASLQQALGEARQRLAQSARYLDWASVQLYARAEDGTDYRPFILRPYRGLLAFQPEHSRFFFGREALQQELLHRVQQAGAGRLPRFQVVAGASGSGKSSLVLAGLVPALPADEWDVLVMRPGEVRGRSPAGFLRWKLAGLWRPAPEPSETATPADVLSEADALRQARWRSSLQGQQDTNGSPRAFASAAWPRRRPRQRCHELLPPFGSRWWAPRCSPPRHPSALAYRMGSPLSLRRRAAPGSHGGSPCRPALVRTRGLAPLSSLRLRGGDDSQKTAGISIALRVIPGTIRGARVVARVSAGSIPTYRQEQRGRSVFQSDWGCLFKMRRLRQRLRSPHACARPTSTQACTYTCTCTCTFGETLAGRVPHRIEDPTRSPDARHPCRSADAGAACRRLRAHRARQRQRLERARIRARLVNVMFLRSNETGNTRVTLTSRVPKSLKRRLEARATRSGVKPSAVAADLLELALTLEERLEPFRLAIDRLVREENLPVPEAIVALLWMDVELDPQLVEEPRS